MDKQTVQELKYIKKWLDEHHEPIRLDVISESMSIFTDPVGMTYDMYKARLDEIYEKLAKEERLDNVYLGMAKELAKLSYAERAKVGCLIVNSGGQIVSQGYNGTPSGFDNCCEEENVTKHEVLHAESNAISKCAKWGGSTDGSTQYFTMSPCFECAKLIIQAGIKRVVYIELYRDTSGVDLLEKAGIEVNQYIDDKQQYDK